MTNFYNKKYHLPNGTLIGNWYEEQCLRDKTNEGRAIIPKHVPKKILNFDYEIPYNPEDHDDTFKRTLGDRHYNSFSTTYQTYGDFKQSEGSYKNLPFKERIFNDFFKRYVFKKDDVIENKEEEEDPETKRRKEYEKKMKEIEESFNKRLLEFCIKKGWMGIRNFKNFLKDLSLKKDNFIHKDDLKFYFLNYGILLMDKEVEYIYFRFQNSKNEIDYNSVFNSLIFVSETRFNKIKEHVEKLHKFQGEKLTKDWFIRYIKEDNHPEAKSGKKLGKEILYEFNNAFPKKIEIIDDREYVQLLCEISACVPDDDNFYQILRCLENL